MRKLIGVVSLITAFFTIAVPAFAVDICPPGGFAKEACTTVADPSKIGPIIQALLNMIFIIGAIAAIFFIVYGGFKWVTSGGDKGAVEGAKQTITAAVVGLIVMFLSFMIINIVGGLFGIPSILNFNLPNITKPGG